MKKRSNKRKTMVSKNRRLLKKIKELSLKDPLTGLYSYQYFTERLSIELKNARRYLHPFSLIIIDIDYFKSVNDIYGYSVGNSILREFAQYLKKFARTSDLIIRYGGAAFAILSPDTDKGGAVAFGQRLCEKMQRHNFHSRKQNIKLKVSIGVTSFPADQIDTLPGLIDAVESAVREAKERGGNRICAFRTADEKEKVVQTKKEDIKDLRSRLKKAGKKLDQALLESIYAFAKAIEARDHYTGKHAEKMISIVREIGGQLELSKKQVATLEHAAVLHDLGKIGIDDNILRKKGKLTKREFGQIKKHPLIGAEILRSIHFLNDVVPLILYHHERFDGKGYTSGLKGHEIPIGARILAIADVYQALISDRPYRKAYTKREALKIIKEASGRQFDPDVVEALIKSLKNNTRYSVRKKN